MQTLLSCRAITAAWDVRPPCRRQDAGGGHVAGQVIGREIVTYENGVASGACHRDGMFRLQCDGSHRHTGRCGNAGGNRLSALVGSQPLNLQRVQVIRSQTLQRAGDVDQSFLHHIAGDLQRGPSRSLGCAGLQQIQLSVLDREFKVLGVPEQLLEFSTDVS